MRGYYNPKNKYVVRGKVLETYALAKGNLGVLVEDACQGRRQLVEFPSKYSIAPPSLESFFGIADSYVGKSEYLERLLKPGSYVDLLSYEGHGPIKEAYYLKAVYGRRPRDWYGGSYSFWSRYGAGYQRAAGHYVPGYNAPRPAYHPGYGFRRKGYRPEARKI